MPDILQTTFYSWLLKYICGELAYLLLERPDTKKSWRQGTNNEQIYLPQKTNIAQIITNVLL